MGASFNIGILLGIYAKTIGFTHILVMFAGLATNSKNNYNNDAFTRRLAMVSRKVCISLRV